MERRSQVLILGAGCAIGRNLQRALGVNRTVGTYRRHRVPNGLFFDVPTMEISDVVEQPHRFSHAIILLAETDPDRCFRDKAATAAVNVDATKRIITWLWDHGIKPVFASSRAVFDGEKGNYAEKDPTRPITEYGQQKREIERFLETAEATYATLRLSSVVSTEPGDGTLFTNWLSSLEAGGVIRCAEGQRFSPVLIDDAVNAFVDAIERDLRGLYHVAGPVAMTRIDMLRLLLRELRRYGPCDPEIEGCRLADFPTAERRALDTSMQSGKLVAATGIRLTSPEQICADVAANAWRLRCGPFRDTQPGTRRVL